jgi:hypothetical protein
MPKVGPFRPLDFKRLTPETEKMYMASFNSTMGRYRKLLSDESVGKLELPNENLDVGTSTGAGKYRLTDVAYSQLLHRLQGHYTELPQELRSNILAFYHDLEAPIATKMNGNDWARLIQELDHLHSVDTDLRHPALAGIAAPPK